VKTEISTYIFSANYFKFWYEDNDTAACKENATGVITDIDYNGVQNMSVSGEPCLNWDVLTQSGFPLRVWTRVVKIAYPD